MTLRRALCLLAVTVVVAGTIYAQSFTATVRGTVVDQSAAVVPGAKIVVTEADRGTTSSTIAGALLKSFRTVEGQRFEFRIEAQNAFNHPVFSDPANSFGASNFGQITGTKGANSGMRQVQLGMKYYF